MMNGGDDASANGGGGGGEDVAMVVVDQQPTEPGLLLSAAAAAASNNGGGGGGNEEAEAVEDEEMAEQHGENGDGPNAGTSSSSSSSRYSLRKRSRQPLLSIQDNSSKQTGPNSKTSRGGSKKQQPPSYQADAFGYVDTSTLTDRQFERLLAQYEEDGARKREQKKQRIERGYADDDYPYVPPPEGDRPAFDDLPKEAVQIVFECLPTVRAVFNLAYQSKYMMSFVEERMDIVIHATVLGDILKYSGTKQSILQRVVERVRERSIHVPSPLRLLKLINAKRCERGADCFAFDLKTGLASKTDMGYFRPYGFAICSACSADCGANKPRGWRSYYHWSRQEDKLVHHAWSKVFNPDKGSDLCIGVDGERLGPIVNAKHAEQIYTAHPHDIDQQKKMFAAIVEKEHGEEGSDESEAFEKSCADLVEIFDQASKEREARHDAFIKEICEKSKVENDAAAARKKARLEPIIAALEESVSDAPLKELALAFEWKDSRYTPIQFQYHFVKNSLGNLLSAPSSASQKKIKAACANIRRKLDILSATSQAEGDEGEAGGDFFSLSFLSTARAETSSSLRKKSLKEISEYCRTNLTGGMKGIIGGGHRWHENDRNMTNDRFFDLLEGGPEKYVDAVLHILSSRNALGDIFSRVVVSSESTNLDKHRSLARVVWEKAEDGMEGGFTPASFYETLSLCQTEFRTMKTNARDYLEEEAVKQFLATGGMDNRVRQSTDQVWVPRDFILRVSPYHNIQIPADIQNLKPYHLLLDRDFASLLRIHRFYRNHISSYGSYRQSVAWLHQSVPDNAN